jgi:hypothetical protein
MSEIDKKDPRNVPERIGIAPFNNQTRFAVTKDPVNKDHSSFLMDELGDLVAQVQAGNSSADDGYKDVQTRLLKCTKVAPVATATLPVTPFKAIDVVNTSFTHTARVRLTLATDSGDVNGYFIVMPELAVRMDFNSDTVKGIQMDVLSDSIDNLATASGADVSSLPVYDAGSAPDGLAVPVVMTFLNA